MTKSNKSSTEFEVKEGRTTITVPHQGKRITFVAPHFGRGRYHDVGEQIDGTGLLRPTFAETVSLVYSATKNQDNNYAMQVLDILNRNWFWGFNEIVYKPGEGAYISDRNRKNIHVPFGFKTGEQSIDALVENPFVIALAEGKEGAEKLAKIAKSKRTPLVWSYEKVSSTEKRVASLNFDSGRLNLGSDSWGDNYLGDGGCAFGVSE